jgi:hypothetical protein
VGTAIESAPAYSFTADEARLAYDSWGCNCGPAALATILGITLDRVHTAVDRVGFAEKRYMSPSMMEQAIGIAGGKIDHRPFLGPIRDQNFPHHGLARIQWTGPWTDDDVNPKWRYRQTHWVASWRHDHAISIFDVNGGILSVADWKKQIVPLIVAEIPRADGGWYVTHSWEVSSV